MAERGWGKKECVELWQEHLVQLKSKILKKTHKNWRPACPVHISDSLIRAGTLLFSLLRSSATIGIQYTYLLNE